MNIDQRSAPDSWFHRCCGIRNNLPHKAWCARRILDLVSELDKYAGRNNDSFLAKLGERFSTGFHVMEARIVGLEAAVERLTRSTNKLELELARARQDIALRDEQPGPLLSLITDS